MTAVLENNVIETQFPGVDEVYDGALAEHPEFQQLDEDEVRGVISAALGRIAAFDAVARQPLTITPETAENIGTVWIFSGTGSYDTPFKPQDNPRLVKQPGFGGFDRARISRAALLARKIAEAKSGKSFRPVDGDIQKSIDQTRDLIEEFGPDIFYSGYPVETANVEELLDRKGTIIPKSRAKILHAELKVTSDQVSTFEYPDKPGIEDKDVVMVSHAQHLGGRILNIAGLFEPFKDGRTPYVSPIAAPDSIRREWALMEARGLVWYAYGAGQAATTAHPYKLLGDKE